MSGGGFAGLQSESVKVGGSTTVMLADWVTDDSLIDATFRVTVMLLLAGSMGGV